MVTIAQIQSVISGAIDKTKHSIKVWMNTAKDDSGTNYVPVVTSDGYQVVSGTVTASAQPGVDIGDVTVNNSTGASAVNIQDGGNTITVDGSLTTVSTVTAVTTITNAVAVTTVKPDGTNTMPSLDTAGRSGFTRTTDGTNTAAVDAANTARTTGTIVQSVQIVDVAGRVPAVDNITKAQQNIELDHHEIHAGESFHVDSHATLNDAETTNIELVTENSTKYCHMVVSWACTGAAHLRVHEVPTVTDDTFDANKAPLNRDRNGATTSVVYDNDNPRNQNSVSCDVELTVDGTLVMEEYAGTGKTQGQYIQGRNEIILKKATEYLFEIVSDSDGNTVNISLDWYEHTNA